MAWELRPVIAGTAGLFLALTLATSAAQAAGKTQSDPLDVIHGQ